MTKDMQKRLAELGFSVTAEGHVKGALKSGLKIGDVTHKDFELRGPLGKDLFAAEEEAATSSPLTFDFAVCARVLVRIGTYNGPFTLDMLGKLKPQDLQTLRLALREAEKLGEG